MLNFCKFIADDGLSLKIPLSHSIWIWYNRNNRIFKPIADAITTISPLLTAFLLWRQLRKYSKIYGKGLTNMPEGAYDFANTTPGPLGHPIRHEGGRLLQLTVKTAKAVWNVK